jgi:iron complex outermembrane receptor protein
LVKAPAAIGLTPALARPIARRKERGIVLAASWALALAFVISGSIAGLAQPSSTNQMAMLKSMSLEDLSNVQIDTVVGASKYEQAVSEAPADVTIITAEDIKHYGWRTVGEALRSVQGLYVTSDRGYDYLGVDGMNRPGDFGGRTLITIDGHRMNDSLFDTAALDTDFMLDLDLVEKIEIIRGPGSSLYGDNAFFAVINIITRRGHDAGGAELASSYGTFDTYTGRVSYGNRFTNGVELMLSGTLYDSGGNPSLYYPQFASVNHGLAQNMDGGWSESAFASLSWKDFSFEGGYVERMKRWPDAPYGSSNAVVIFDDPVFHTHDQRAFAEFKFDHRFDSDWELMARTYYDYYSYNGWYPYNYNPSTPSYPTTVNEDVDQCQSVGGEVQASRTFFADHHVIAGVEARDDFQLQQINYDISPHALYLNSTESGYYLAIYAQDEYRILTNLTLNAGVRYDDYSSFGDTVNPRAALIFHPWHPSTLKLLYGQAFRAPNANEEYYYTVGYQSNLKLEPETIRTYQLVYEHDFNKNWKAETSLFYNDIRNLINFEVLPDGNYSYVNDGFVTTKGIDAELDAHWASGLKGSASYTFTRAVNAMTGTELNNSPEQLAKLNLAVPLWRQKIFASAEIQAMSSRTTVEGGTVGGYWVANITLFSHDIVKNLEMSASIYNLFDRHYSDPVSPEFTQPSIVQNGRTFRVKLTYKF